MLYCHKLIGHNIEIIKLLTNNTTFNQLNDDIVQIMRYLLYICRE